MRCLSLTARMTEVDGHLSMLEGWHKLDAHQRIDLLNDWIGMLTELHNETRYDIYGFDYTPNLACQSGIHGRRD